MLVFTNGCFDILHPGHINLLNRVKALGTRLVVGINSDASVRNIKGPGRPFMSQEDRAAVLMALESVDEVMVFDEATPEKLIRRIKPDILVKGGDWKVNEIVGADFVAANGGRVVSLPIVDGYSSSSVVERIRIPSRGSTDNLGDHFSRSIRQHIELFEQLLADSGEAVRECAETLIETIRGGNKIMICGNGGSAADSQHFAAELVGRFERERVGLPAIALTTDTSALTALANDYAFERVFARQVEALAREGDCLIAISTSGNSPNIVAAVMAARSRRCKVVGMTGSQGKKLAGISDVCLMVPSDRTARIQEAHVAIAHVWCEMIDAAFDPSFSKAAE